MPVKTYSGADRRVIGPGRFRVRLKKIRRKDRRLKDKETQVIDDFRTISLMSHLLYFFLSIIYGKTFRLI